MNIWIKKARLAGGRVRSKHGEMNKTESSYMGHLDLMLKCGEILWRSEHDALTVKLAHDLRYTPDFIVLAKDGILEAHDCKGAQKNKRTLEDGTVKDLGHKPRIEDDALVKLKMLAELWPIRVYTAMRVAGNWDVRQIGRPDEQDKK